MRTSGWNAGRWSDDFHRRDAEIFLTTSLAKSDIHDPIARLAATATGCDYTIHLR